jgi:hypothetical protein
MYAAPYSHCPKSIFYACNIAYFIWKRFRCYREISWIRDSLSKCWIKGVLRYTHHSPKATLLRNDQYLKTTILWTTNIRKQPFSEWPISELPFSEWLMSEGNHFPNYQSLKATILWMAISEQPFSDQHPKATILWTTILRTTILRKTNLRTPKVTNTWTTNPGPWMTNLLQSRLMRLQLQGKNSYAAPAPTLL